MKTSITQVSRDPWVKWHVHRVKRERVVSIGECIRRSRFLFWVRTVQGASVWNSQMSGSWAKNKSRSSRGCAEAWVFPKFHNAGRRQDAPRARTICNSDFGCYRFTLRFNLELNRHLTFSSSDSCSSWSAIFSSGTTSLSEPSDVTGWVVPTSVRFWLMLRRSLLYWLWKRKLQATA